MDVEVRAIPADVSEYTPPCFHYHLLKEDQESALEKRFSETLLLSKPNSSQLLVLRFTENIHVDRTLACIACL